jgi:hypothetical protein
LHNKAFNGLSVTRMGILAPSHPSVFKEKCLSQGGGPPASTPPPGSSGLDRDRTATL